VTKIERRRVVRVSSPANRHSVCAAFPIILSSPSGAGKTSIARGVIRRDPRVVYSVSATTRPMRPGERNHHAYHFFSESEFLRRQRAGYFVETAPVYDHLYGTPKPFIQQSLARGRDVILDLDIQGARSMRRLFPKAVTVFITVPDFAELQRRLRGRKTDPPEVIRKRLACAAAEWRAAREFDYVIVNRDLKQAVDDVMMIIRVERLRTARQVRITGKESGL
jgi:guanylate kinase